LAAYSRLTARNSGIALSTATLRTRVTMRCYTTEEIDAYVASGDPFDKAGAYAVQSPTFRPAARLDGCWSNVVGLPLCLASALLARAGVTGTFAVCEAPAGGPARH
jgi:predicted house-cleaning NTP pyrophosphatase (Maf/HAM1 superfamily)